MSTKEKVYNIIDGFTEEQLEQVLAMLNSVKKMVDEANDDMFCEKLLKDYLNDESPDKHESVTIEELADKLGIELE